MEQLVNLKFLVQQVELEWLVFRQMKKIVPFITCEIPFGQNVCELVFGVNVTDLDLGVHSNPVKQPFQSNSVGS